MLLSKRIQQGVKATVSLIQTSLGWCLLYGKWQAIVIILFGLLATIGFFLPWLPTTFDSGLTLALGHSMYMNRLLWQQSFPELFSWLWLVVLSTLTLLAVGIDWLFGFASLWARLWSCLLGAASLIIMYVFSSRWTQIDLRIAWLSAHLL